MAATPITDFIRTHYRHFNAAALVDATRDYQSHIRSGGSMIVTLAGAMSTAELGISLAEMIRRDKVQAISCTGANLEEDLFNLVAHDFYQRIPRYRELSRADEQALLEKHLNRVTDTCIPEEEAFRRVQAGLEQVWSEAQVAGKRFFPHEYLYQLIRGGQLEKYYQIPVAHSWLYAACEKNLPIFVPGWEDSTTGNIFAASVISGTIKNTSLVKSGIDYMIELVSWYKKSTETSSIGFFQIGGGIAGDFPICVVPLMHQDLEMGEVPLWGYFCQISDSTTSYGSYSGAVPNEKITWGKLGVDTPSHIIESDATIVAPLIFQAILEEGDLAS